MIDGNTAALDAYMKDQDDAQALYDEYNTIENVQEIWEYLLTDDFMYLMEQVFDDPVANIDIIVTLAEIVKDKVNEPEVLDKLEKAFELSYPQWFDDLVDKEICKRAGLE
jgi:hypothetical protein